MIKILGVVFDLEWNQDEALPLATATQNCGVLEYSKRLVSPLLRQGRSLA